MRIGPFVLLLGLTGCLASPTSSRPVPNNPDGAVTGDPTETNPNPTANEDPFEGNEVARISYVPDASSVAIEPLPSGDLGVFFADASLEAFYTTYSSSGGATGIRTSLGRVDDVPLAATASSNRSIFAVYSDSKSNGEAVALDGTGAFIYGPMNFTAEATEYAIADSTNGVFVAFNDETANYMFLDRTSEKPGKVRNLPWPEVGSNDELAAITVEGGGILAIGGIRGVGGKRDNLYAAFVFTDETNAQIDGEGGVVVENVLLSRHSFCLAQFGSGNIALFYTTVFGEGRFMVFDSTGVPIGVDNGFDVNQPASLSATHVAGGDVVVAYRQEANGNLATYRRIIDGDWTVGEATPFVQDEGIVGQTDATTLPDGTTVLGYIKLGNDEPPYEGELLFLR